MTVCASNSNIHILLVGDCSRLRNGLNDPCLQVFVPLCNLLLLTIGKTCDLLLVNRIQQSDNYHFHIYII